MGSKNGTGQEVVEYDGIKFVVKAATILTGTKRYRLMNEAAAEMGVADLTKLEAPPGVDKDIFGLRVFTYPNFIAATVSATGVEWPMSFEDFCDVPEPLWNLWSEAVRRVNPHWYPDNAGGADDASPKA